MYLPQLAELARNDLSGGEARVLLLLMARAPLGECMRLGRQAMAKDLGVHLHTVDRAVASLIERHVLIRDPDDQACYWLDPDLFWRGRLDEHSLQRKRLAAS